MSSTHHLIPPVPKSAPDVICARLMVCVYGDGLAHRYREQHIIDRRCEYLIPVCQEDQFYPCRHDGELVRTCPEAWHPSPVSCSCCDAWSRRHRETVVVRGEVAAS